MIVGSSFELPNPDRYIAFSTDACLELSTQLLVRPQIIDTWLDAHRPAAAAVPRNTLQEWSVIGTPGRCLPYGFQKRGSIRARTAKNSSRPSHMRRIITSFCHPAKNAKFSVGPTDDRPGPMFETVASEAVAAVTMSVSPTDSKRAPPPQPSAQKRRSAVTPRARPGRRR